MKLQSFFASCSEHVNIECSVCGRMAAIRNLVTGKQLMIVLLKLFDYCLKVKANRQELIKVEMNSISIMLGALNLV